MTDIEKKISKFISRNSSRPVEVHLDESLTAEEVKMLENMMEGCAESERFDDGPSTDLLTASAPEITIPVAAYAQLLRAQTYLDMLQTAYSRGVDSWRYEGLLSLMFGPLDNAEGD